MKTSGDFKTAAGANTNIFIGDSTSGSLALAGGSYDHFDGVVLNGSLWSSGSWGTGSYSTSQTNSLLTEPGNGFVRSKSSYTHGVFEAAAQFGNGAWQHIGFGSDGFTGNRFLLFSTISGDGNLYVRVNNNSSEQRVNLGPVPSGIHTYRIEWTSINASTDGAVFYKDGVQVAQTTFSSTGASGWYLYLSNGGTANLVVDQAQVTPPFTLNGTYTSKTLDAGLGATWQSASWNATVPAGTSLTVQARTSSDGSAWTSWSTFSGNGNILPQPFQYIQFQLSMTTTNVQVSPVLSAITFVKSTVAAPTATMAATATKTLSPTATRTLPATATQTLLPTATNTATRTPTRTLPPTATQTPLPSATNTPTKTATSTLPPPATNTPTRTASPTLLPTATQTPLPTATKTPAPTATATVAPTTQPTPTATSTTSSGRIGSLKVITNNPGKFERFEVQFSVMTTSTNLDMPYDSNPPAGVQAGMGVTVNGLFSSDNWNTTLTQPAFLYQPYTYSSVNGKDHFTPTGAPVWAVRFTPQQTGAWQYRLSVQDSQGQSIYPDPGQTALSFNASLDANNPIGNHGFIGVSPTDKRYFQFQDGNAFVGVGFNDGFSDSASVEQKMTSYQQNQMNFMRVWMSGSGINGSQWTSWASNFLSQDGYLPGTSYDIANTYNGNPVSMRLDDANPCLYADFWQGGIPVEPSTRYQVTARVKLNGVTGPSAPGEYGFVIKQGAWLGQDCLKPGVGTNITTAVTGSSGWITVTGTYTTGSSDKWLGNLYLTRENASAGQVYIDEVHLFQANDPAKVDLLRQPYADVVDHFSPMNAAQWDRYIQSAEQHGVYLKLVIDEKNEWIRNHMGADGKMVATGSNDNFYAADGTKVRWLQQAWWRYIIARWGYSPAIHSFEFINEGDPYSGKHYDAAEAMAKYFHANDPSKHMVTTSFWAAFPNKEFWSNPQYSDIDYADIHAYIATGWGLNASFLPATMLETRAAYVHSGGASAVVDGASQVSTSAVPRGLVIQGQGEWVIKYWMKAEGLTANCPYAGSGSMLRLRWQLDGGNYHGGKEGVTPANSQSKDYICTSKGGTFDWTQFSSTSDRDGVLLPTSARIIVSDNLPHELNLLLENQYGTAGKGWIDDIQIINPAGKIQPVIGQFDVTAMDTDTAWYNQAYAQVFGGGSLVGAQKPLVRGETGVDFVGNQNYNPDLLKDTQGIWLHNNVWGQINSGGMADLFWWATETIPQSIFSNFATFRNFMSGIPLANGHYQDSQAQSSTPQLRVMGQRDDTNGQMHLWVQNTQHNWKQVVNGPAILAVAGSVTVPNVAVGNYKVEWWDTYSITSPIILTQTIASNGTLTLVLPAPLSTDIAVKITKVP